MDETTSLSLLALIAAATMVGVDKYIKRRSATRINQTHSHDRWDNLITGIVEEQERFQPTITYQTEQADLGNTNESVRSIQTMISSLRSDVCSWYIINHVVNSFVNAGLYREAIDFTSRWPHQVLDQVSQLDPTTRIITHINQAEAYHNLGEHHKALEILDSFDDWIAQNPIALHGRACLKAWILIYLGRTNEARALLESVDPKILSPGYISEVHYTWAELHRKEQDYTQATHHVEQGQRLAIRASSERNGLFIKAEILAQQHRLESSVELFEMALAHRYKAQCAKGLNAYCEVLKKLGRNEKIADIQQVILKYDPQSQLTQSPSVES